MFLMEVKKNIYVAYKRIREKRFYRSYSSTGRKIGRCHVTKGRIWRHR